ncbi:hypothetical protein C2E23DRAFT_856252 [Lenzites betulinus]|nr:hypothetical protein C2E23DRAFT_856252 [Lenzites betulinus]
MQTQSRTSQRPTPAGPTKSAANGVRAHRPPSSAQSDQAEEGGTTTTIEERPTSAETHLAGERIAEDGEEQMGQGDRIQQNIRAGTRPPEEAMIDGSPSITHLVNIVQNGRAILKLLGIRLPSPPPIAPEEAARMAPFLSPQYTAGDAHAQLPILAAGTRQACGGIVETDSHLPPPGLHAHEAHTRHDATTYQNIQNATRTYVPNSRDLDDIGMTPWPQRDQPAATPHYNPEHGGRDPARNTGEIRCHDNETARNPHLEARYVRGSELIRISAVPADGYPAVHANSPYDDLRYITPTRLLAFDTLPPQSTCLIDLFGQADLNHERLQELRPRLRETVEAITGDTEVVVAPPEEAPDGQGLSNLLNRICWDTSILSFRVVPRIPLPPLFVFAVTNATVKEGTDIDSALQATLLNKVAFAATVKIISKDRNSRFASAEEGAISTAMSAFGDVLDLGGSQYVSITGPVARIYCTPPTLDADLWLEWRKELTAVKFPFAKGPVRKRGRCKMCHGTDHTTTLCAFSNKKIPEWVGKIIPRSSNPRRAGRDDSGL